MSPEVPCLSIFLAGEGSSELGRWDGSTEPRRIQCKGTIEALLSQIKPNGWCVTKAIKWCNIRKANSEEKRDHEVRNVLGACLMAIENKCEIIVFCRDTDGDKKRMESINRGIEEAKRLFGDQLTIVGGCAIKILESWLLAIAGQSKTESLSKPKVFEKLKKHGIKEKKTESYIALIDAHGIKKISKDAHSLHQWLKSAKSALYVC